MLLFLVVALAAVTVPLAGGRLALLGSLDLRRTWLLVAALAVQVVAISVVPGAPEPLLEAAHLGSYVLAGAFVVANRRLPGVVLMGLGGALNALVIAVNGGTMPADPDALATAGRTVTDEFVNSAPVADARLAFLGDVFAVPRWFPLANVFSVGDVVLAVGALVLLHCACGSRLAPRRWRGSPAPVDPLLEVGPLVADGRVVPVAGQDEGVRRQGEEALLDGADDGGEVAAGELGGPGAAREERVAREQHG